jgi:16S rRNA (guanine1207-N2)-methyltransferase
MTDSPPRAAVYGSIDPALAETPRGALQLSPLQPGSTAIEALEDASLDEIAILAPPGVLERRFVLAHALRALAPGGRLTALAPKDKGGSRLGKELEAFGCEVIETARRHNRICEAERPAAPVGLADAIADGAPRLAPELGLWTQPGIFSWDRVDPGSALLAATIPRLSGHGADLGCGVGWLAHPILREPGVKSLAMIDIDRRAVDAARHNVDDPRVQIHWADARGDFGAELGVQDLHFVVMNPPFHDQSLEDRSLGFAFIAAARRSLRKGGVLWMVANRHLPYEAKLTELFKTVTPRADSGGFKVIEART